MSKGKKISNDLFVRREPGVGPGNNTRYGVQYVVLTVYGRSRLHKPNTMDEGEIDAWLTPAIDAWLAPAEARKLVDWIDSGLLVWDDDERLPK